MRSRKFVQTGMRNLFWLIIGVLIMGVWALPARADTLETFNFSGTLVTGYNGDSAVTGSFTLDTSGSGSITAFDFTTPVGMIDTSGGWTGSVYNYTPAYSPNADFVQLAFIDRDADDLSLIFETSLPSFAGNTFDTSGIEPTSHTVTASSLNCQRFPTECSTFSFGSGFSSGNATAVTPASEPPTLMLLAIDLLGLGALLLFGKRFGLEMRS